MEVEAKGRGNGLEIGTFICFDLGDTIMIEETEEKDAEATTQTADLIPGLADLIRALHAQGVMLGLVADTRPGTYRNVLRQHELLDRDIAGGKEAGFETCWFHWNDRYPGPEREKAVAADGMVASAEELRRFIDGWLARAEAPA
jgi:phosphoglycolate phosphatase-like HAD superfamily hydrolase